MTRVVNVRHDPFIRYIGRTCYNYQDEGFGNPFTVKKYGRGKALFMYREWLMQDKQNPLLIRIWDELKDSVLGCFCRPKDGFKGRLLCHGQIIAALLDGIRPEDVL